VTGPTPRPGIMEIELYVPGKSKLAGRRKTIKLSSNEGALGPSPGAVKAYRRAARGIERYPDGQCTELRAAIGHRHGLDPRRILCGAGSDEILYNLARAYAGLGDEILFSHYAYTMYPIIAHSVGAAPVAAPEPEFTAEIDALLARVSAKTRILYLANPNNPTGTYVAADEMKRLRAGLREDVLLVVDSAYAEFVVRNDYSAGAELVDAGANTVMTRTFSKIHGLAALRVGWAYCPPAIHDALDRLRSPFGVSAPAQAAGAAAMEDGAHIAKARDHNAAWLPWLRDRLAELGLACVPSAANFLLVRFPDADGKRAADANRFLEKRGIIVRDTTVYHVPQYLRITIGREDEMRAVVRALAEFMG